MKNRAHRTACMTLRNSNPVGVGGRRRSPSVRSGRRPAEHGSR
jgi:hypothetical protein